MTQQELASWHESGHAVAAVARRVPLLRVDVRRVGNYVGWCNHGECEPESEAVILAAGPVAEREALGTGGYNWNAGGRDWDRLLTLSCRFPKSRDWMAARVQDARRIVLTHWPAVAWLAGALLERGELDGSYIENHLRSIVSC